MTPSPRAHLRTVATGVLRILYPPRCLGCGAGVDEAEEPLCARCTARLDRPDAAALGARFARTGDGDAVDAVFALWRFDAQGTVQRLQHALKYGNRPAYGRRLGARLGARYAEAPPAPDVAMPDVVVPVPLHRRRRLERGYNQSAALADGVADALGIPAAAALHRTRPTRTQTRLARDARRANVDGAFAVAYPDTVAGRRVLLVDDVLTTGATLCAAARTLRAGGASHIVAVTLAAAGV